MEQRDQDFFEAGKAGMSVESFGSDRDRDFYEAGKAGIEIEQPNLMQRVSQTVSDKVTGERESEYPNMPEITEANLGFFESFIPNLKLGLTADPVEKANIIKSEFGHDPRFGGLYEDEMGHPIVKWENTPYYVNKPGASMQDATDVVAQATQFMPAARVAGKAGTLGGRFLTGAAGAMATDLAQQQGVIASDGKTETERAQTVMSGAIGGATEAIMPPLLRTAGRGIGAVSKLLGRGKNFPRYNPSSPLSAPMTTGQRSGDINILRREEAARQGGYGVAASDTMRAFDERQLGHFRNNAADIQRDIGAGSGYATEVPTDIGEQLQRRLIDEASRRKSGVSAAYDAAAEASQARPAYLSREGVQGLTDDILAIPREMNIARFQVDQMPGLKAALAHTRKIRQLTESERFRPQNYNQIEATRKALGNMRRDAQKGSTEHAAIGQIISKVDSWTDDAITRGFMSGDETTIDAIQKARGLSREYHKVFGKGSGDPAGNAMVKLLDEKQATPLEVVNLLVGFGRTRATPKAIGIIKRTRDVFGAESHEMGLIKDALLMKAFTGVSRGERSVSRETIVSGGRNLLQGDGRGIAKELFSRKELQRIDEFVEQVAKTITPDDARNPSRSAWTMIQMMREHNLLTVTGKTLKRVPGISEVGGVMEEQGGKATARQMIGEVERLISAPLIEAGVAREAVTNWREEQRRKRIEERAE